MKKEYVMPVIRPIFLMPEAMLQTSQNDLQVEENIYSDPEEETL